MFVREDWSLFRNVATLGQKAGVPTRRLAHLVVKELVDNALDAGANVTLTQKDNWIFVQDDGPGLPGGEAEMARLFSIKRPLTSSKLIRVPSRGALGNGLRVVVGAVLASQGKLYVETGGVRYNLTPQDDGTTHVHSAPCPHHPGTLVAVSFGKNIPVPDDVLTWGNDAQLLANIGKPFKGKTSPWWYDSDSFFEMCQAAGARKLSELLLMFRDITASKALELGNKAANSLSREEARQLLSKLRQVSADPKPSVLGKIGDVFAAMSHAHTNGNIVLKGSELPAILPFSIDVFVQAKEEGADDSIQMFVNRTPITGTVDVQRQKSHQLGIMGCGLKHLVDVGRKPVFIVCNVTTPYMPVTTDGKEPDLFQYVTPLFETIEKAARKAKRTAVAENGGRMSQRDVIANNLTAAIAKASGDGTYRYSLRQLFYAVRPYMLQTFGKEPEYNYFAQVITDIEASNGDDLPGLYRDARGVIYHPHTGEEIPLGTLNVEKYERPAWTFNKILYSEKEGFFSILKDAGWPERNDCALLTSKGFASRAARDVLDLIGESQEEIYFFCIHDADASGTLIYQALTEATRARGARKVHVINLGLDPWEALDMGLQVETFRDKDSTSRNLRALPVASYVSSEWEKWLQTKRVELNAMTSPEFIEWLDNKFEEHAEKVVPPTAVLRAQFEQDVRSSVEQRLATEILEKAGFREQVNELVTKATAEAASLDLESMVRTGLAKVPEDKWSKPLADKADAVAQNVLKP